MILSGNFMHELLNTYSVDDHGYKVLQYLFYRLIRFSIIKYKSIKKICFILYYIKCWLFFFVIKPAKYTKKNVKAEYWK